MRKIEFDEVRNILEYEKLREAAKARNLEVTKHRRVALGERLMLLFENRETVLFQIQEMIRTERIVEQRKIQDEIDVYNGLVPDPGELSATLFIEIPEIVRLPQQEVRRLVNRFLGLDRECVQLEIGPLRIPARFEEGKSQEERMSAVHFVRFALPPEARQALADPVRSVGLTVDHPHYQARQDVAPETRRELQADLASV